MDDTLKIKPMTQSDRLFIARLRHTGDEGRAAVVRWILGLLFVMTGLMKLTVPMLADAWSGQLVAAEIPFYALSLRGVPLVEIAVGLSLAVGLFARPTALVVIGIMTVATYVHIAIADSSLFPLQPAEPIVPLTVIILALYILWKGAGSWSWDLKASRQSR